MNVQRKDPMRLQLDAAARAHQMAIERHDNTERDKQFKRIRKLLRQAAKPAKEIRQ